MKDHYKVLGLPHSASQEEIKSAFKQLAVQFHPDKHQGDEAMEERFKEINVSYQILSDPHAKASFDLKWNYQRFNDAYTTQETYRRHYQPRPGNYRPGGYTNSDKENRKATMYAFAFTFIIALVVTGVIYGRKAYFQNQFDYLLEERRGMFEQAQRHYDKGEMDETLAIIDELQPYYPEEQDMSVFEQDVLQSIELQAEQFFQEGNYPSAIQYMEAFIAHAGYPPYDVYARLAQAYQRLGDHDKAIDILKELITQDFEIVGTLMLIAEIYRVDVAQDSLALQYYQLAREAVTNQYIAVYGEAYPLTINANRVPVSHYLLYNRLTELFTRVGDFDEAIQANRWARRVWPDSSRLYEQAGYIRAQQGLYTQACDHYRKAREKGSLGAFPDYCP